MTIARKIQQRGNSASLTLPKSVLEAMGVNLGDEVYIEVVGETVLLHGKPAKSRIERAREVERVARKTLQDVLREAPTEPNDLSAEEQDAIEAAERRGRRD